MISMIPYRLSSPPVEDEGIRFFLDNYVTAGSQQAGSEYEFVGATMFPMINHSSSFANAVSSVGYAGLSNVGKDPQHAIIARRKYAASIRDITRALGDVANSDLDATLKSVLLLAAYEVSLSNPSLRLALRLLADCEWLVSKYWRGTFVGGSY